MRFRNSIAVGIAAVAFSIVGPARATVLELRPAVSIPASCNVTPVYGSDTGPALPWIDAQPSRVSRIRLTLTSRIGPHATYLLLPAGGVDVVIRAPSHSITVNATRVSGPPARFSALLLTGAYQRLKIPTPGCWELQLTAGNATGFMRIWAAPAP